MVTRGTGLPEHLAVDLSFRYVGYEEDEGGLWRWMRLDEEP